LKGIFERGKRIVENSVKITGKIIMKKISLFLLCTLLTTNTFTRNIFEDVRNKNKEALRQRLENCENCAIKDEHGNNALHIAAEKGDTEIIDILTTAPSCDSWSDWFYAWLYAPTLPNIDEQNDDGDSPLICATDNGQLATAEQLVKKGADMKMINKKRLSAPFLAVLKDDPRFIRIFVAHKLNLVQHTRNGDTIFHVAVKEKKPKAMHYCVQETTLHNITNNEGKTPTFLVIDQNIDMLRMFKQSQLNAAATSTGIKPIHYATEHNKYDAINYLLNNNISIDEPDTKGNPPIFYANNETTLNFLLNHKADLKKRNNKGEDILAIATHNKNHALIATLTQKHNMDIDARDNNGHTSFMRAAIEQNYESMSTLADLGANIRITDNTRENVLHKIARIGDQKGAKLVLNREKALLTDLNKNGDSPLFVAIQNGNLTFAEFLIDAGSRIDTINNDGNTIIHELVKKNNNWLLNKLLKKINYNLINHKNKKGECPLSLAVYNDDVETIKALLLYKANTYTVDQDGNNIAHVAAKNGSLKTLQFLQSRQDLFKSHNHRGETPFTCGAHQGQLEATKLLLTEDHFINGDVTTIINTMKNQYFFWDNEYRVCEFLSQQHKNRLNECESIIAIAQSTFTLISENNNLCNTLRQKQYNVIYNPVELYSNYSENELYKMYAADRNRIKAKYLECQNRELRIRDDFKQRLATINEQEQKEKARVQALKDELIKAKASAEAEQNKKEEPEHSPIEPTVTQETNTHSDHICGACLKAPSVKNMSNV
jgi:ankyrin repeat protein